MIELPDVAAAAVEPEPPSPQPALRVCVFSLASSLFAVDVTSAREVAVFESVTRVPRAASSLIGVANLRGAIMPIVDAQPLLGLPPHRPAGAMEALVLEDGPFRAAVAIDAALGLETFTGAPEHGLILGVFGLGADHVTLLDAGALLAALRRSMERLDHTEEDRP